MPTYDYRCTGCKHTFELRQPFESNPIAECPVCKKDSKRLFQLPAVIYKGSGFYTTDYRKADTNSANNSNSSSSSSKNDEPSSSSKNDEPSSKKPSDPPRSTTDGAPAAKEIKPD